MSKVWLSELTTRGCSSNTIELYSRNMNEFIAFLGKDKKAKELKVDNITREQLILALSTYRERKDGRSGREVQRSGQSVMSYYTTIKSFLNWCDSSDRLTQNPIRSVMRPKVAQRVPKALSIQDCQLLLDQAGKSSNRERDLLLVKLGLTMGLRLSEISNIKVDDFSPSISIEEFFQNYTDIFFQIPKLGATNSHEYLVKASSDYIDSNIVNNDIQALIDEINALQQQNLELNQQLVNSAISSSHQA